MKIGFVLDDSLDKNDGVQQYVTTLGKWFHAQGNEVHYLVGHTERRDLPNIHSLSRNIQVHFNQNRMSTPLPANSDRIRDILSKESFDILHVQMPYSPFMSARVINAAPKSTAIIGTFHILPFSKIESVATRVLALILWRSRRRFDAVVSVSKPAAKFAWKRFRVRSSVVPNAVAVGHFQVGRRLAKFDDAKLNIVYLGRLVERKGCLDLLKALSLLHEQNVLLTTRVIIAGKGPLLGQLKDFVRAHKLSKIVQFIGYVSEQEKPDLLASADIAVLPSTGGESFGIVLVEAMAAGANVVIAGDNPGYRTVMGDHYDQIVDPRDTRAFARTIKHFIVSEQSRKHAKKWQESRASQYDVQVVGNHLHKIYSKALRNRLDVR